MKTVCCILAGALALTLGGCGDANTGHSVSNHKEESAEEATIQANLAKLSPEDRQLAEQQKFCCVEEENRLGSMGKPVKVLLNGQPAFLCCGGCEEKAWANPEQTLKKVQELKAKNAGK